MYLESAMSKIIGLESPLECLSHSRGSSLQGFHSDLFWLSKDECSAADITGSLSLFFITIPPSTGYPTI